MNLMELQMRLAGHPGAAPVRLKITGTLDAEGCVEITCVETVIDEQGQRLVLSDEAGGGD